ncbi:MAG: HAMP domain-containing sensor histidine kinase [Gammaproteobacteria bacterium]|nr:HAMP domain-containing sensor histidine kinase [Gammaproteobacteria bacterium]MDE0280066.1 HAMP domain-containing sensor histidine kinase [Gammaproteobacteria bacterium]
MKVKRKLFHSYTFRLALLYALIFSSSTLILFYFFYLFTASYMTQQMDNTIEAEIQGLAERYDRDGLEGLTRLIAERVNRSQGTGNSLYLLTTYTLEPLVGNLDRWPLEASIDNEKWLEFSLEVNEQTNETHLARARIFRLPGRYGLLVGRDIHQLTQAKLRIVQALTWGLAIMVLLAFVGGLVLSRRTVRNIERINQTARSIMSGNLSRRVEITNRNDDFDQLAANLNQMLDRIQTLMEDIRRVSDNIAHDLRTPLTRLRQHMEEARRQVDSESISAISLESSIREADSLLTTFNALLRIARIEAGQVTTDFAVLDYRTLVEDVVEFYEPLAEEKNQFLTVDAGNTIKTMGDRDLLFQALANVIENAIKYTQENGHISVILSQLDNDAVITIADNGPGIPAEERERVFRRFYRLDRSRSTTGNGLGLSMVAAVVTMHQGQIRLMDNDPGLKTVMQFPLLGGVGSVDPPLAEAA